jgi:hypothetical protein
MKVSIIFLNYFVFKIVCAIANKYLIYVNFCAYTKFSETKYKTLLRKIRKIIKLIVVLNLWMIDITFTILLFIKENYLMFFSVFIIDCRKRSTLIRDMMWYKYLMPLEI